MDLVCVEPAQIPTEGIFAAQVLTCICRDGTAKQLTNMKITVAILRRRAKLHVQHQTQG
jgi:hypothetical protein